MSMDRSAEVRTKDGRTVVRVVAEREVAIDVEETLTCACGGTARRRSVEADAHGVVLVYRCDGCDAVGSVTDLASEGAPTYHGPVFDGRWQADGEALRDHDHVGRVGAED